MRTTVAPTALVDLVTATDLLEQAVHLLQGTLEPVGPGDLARSTPCERWDVALLLAHLEDAVGAFTEAAGLPDLPGKPPFGGHILSHDFVEAALIRRVGWTVKIADDIQGSYEETPPSLVDFAIRDRRWCQGNLQHVGVLRAAGLHWVSRFHLVSGILSYLASFLWLLLILSGFALAVQGYFTPPDYFSDPHQLFPTWPQIDSALQLQLLALTGVLVAAPSPLADAGVPIFPIATHDTDWVLVPGDKLEDAVAALRGAGHEVLT